MRLLNFQQVVLSTQKKKKKKKKKKISRREYIFEPTCSQWVSSGGLHNKLGSVIKKHVICWLVKLLLSHTKFTHFTASNTQRTSNVNGTDLMLTFNLFKFTGK